MKLRRRTFLTLLGGSLASATSCVTGFERAQRRPGKPNVIYAFSDEHRWQSMSFTEMPAVHTPHLAHLASQGVEFTHCISNYPVCSPHRGMLMTGRWPYEQGVIDNGIPLSPDQATLGTVFRDAGYRTGYIGKWHLGGVRAEPFGFEHSLIWTETNVHYDRSQYHPASSEPVQPRGYNATLMTDQALEFIETHRNTAFFLMISWNPPHSDFLDAPEDKKWLYPEGSLPYRPNVILTDSTSEPSPTIWKQNSWPYYQGYHAHVSAIDEEVGRLMAGLEELGLGRDTVLVYSSDHGSMLGSHGLGSKRQPYEESIRVPFLIRWPGVIPAGERKSGLFGTVDIMPTLCGLAGLPIPQTCRGMDFSGALRGRSGPNPKSQFIMHISKKNASGGESHPAPLFRGVRTARYTYAVCPDRLGFLFDNLEDPYQKHNRIEDLEYAEVRAKLHAELHSWLTRAKDPFPLPS